MKYLKKAGEELFLNTMVYKYAILLAFTLDEIMRVHTLIGDYLKVFLLWGVAIVIANLIIRKEYPWNRHMLWLYLFLAAYVVTSLINGREYLGSNIKILTYTAVFFCLLYGMRDKVDLDTWKKQMVYLMYYLVAITFVLGIISLVTYVLGLNITYKDIDGYCHIGVYDNRLWGLYNPNVGSTLNVISIAMSMGLLWMLEKGQKGKKIFLILNLIVEYLFLILTGSRTALGMLAVGVGAFAFFWARERGKHFVWNFLLCVVTVVLVMVSVVPVKTGLAYVPPTVQKITTIDDTLYVALNKQLNPSSSAVEKKKASKKVDLKRKEKEEDRGGGILTGRQYLWSAGVQALKEHPFFGVSKAATYDKAKPYIEDEFWLLSLESSLHNSYITVLVASGIVGFILFMGFLILNVIDYIRCGFGNSKKSRDKIFLTLCIVIALMMMTELLEGRIIYRTEIFNVLFWCLLGYASHFIRINRREEKQSVETEL